jgi:hypothetical protein
MNYINIITIILVIFCSLILIRILRFFYNLIIYYILCLRYNRKYDRETQKILKSSNNTTNEIKEKNLIKERELIIRTNKLNETKEIISEQEIVGIAKPRGMWTKFVTEQKISWIKAMIGTKTDSRNFWREMIKAQEKAQGKYKGRNR